MTPSVEAARVLAIEAHRGQFYDADRSYFYAHVAPVVTCLKGHLKRHPRRDEEGFAATCVTLGYLHDVLEDAPDKAARSRLTRQISNTFGTDILRHVQRLTRPRGSRAETLEPYLDAIAEAEETRFVKLADRLCNVEEARRTMAKHFRMYAKEAAVFRAKLYRPEDRLESMWIELTLALKP